MRLQKMLVIGMAAVMIAGAVTGCAGSGGSDKTAPGDAASGDEASFDEASFDEASFDAAKTETKQEKTKTDSQAADQKESGEAAPLADKAAEPEMSYEELVAAAKAEGSLRFYGANSFLQDAADNFAKEFGIKVEFTQLGETEMIEKVSSESEAGMVNADMVCAQDTYRVAAELVEPGFAMNWKNTRVGAILGSDDCMMMTWYYDTKTFMYNPELVGEGYLTNLWRITDPQYKGLFTFKDPAEEGVNYDMLTMLTSDAYASKLAEAYKAYYGKDITLTTDNAGWEFIKMLFENGVILTTSDTTSAATVGALGQADTWVGYFSTQRFSTQEEKGISLSYDLKSCVPAGGYAYPVYAIVLNDCENEHAAKLFSEWLLSENGWAAFNDYYGGFSANPANTHATEYGFEEIKQNIVMDDPAYLVAHRADVEDFIETLR